MNASWPPCERPDKASSGYRPSTPSSLGGASCPTKGSIPPFSACPARPCACAGGVQSRCWSGKARRCGCWRRRPFPRPWPRFPSPSSSGDCSPSAPAWSYAAIRLRPWRRSSPLGSFRKCWTLYSGATHKKEASLRLKGCLFHTRSSPPGAAYSRPSCKANRPPTHTAWMPAGGWSGWL